MWFIWSIAQKWDKTFMKSIGTMLISVLLTKFESCFGHCKIKTVYVYARLCCLSFDLRLLITTLVYSIFSDNVDSVRLWCSFRHIAKERLYEWMISQNHVWFILLVFCLMLYFKLQYTECNYFVTIEKRRYLDSGGIV